MVSPSHSSSYANLPQPFTNGSASGAGSPPGTGGPSQKVGGPAHDPMGEMLTGAITHQANSVILGTIGLVILLRIPHLVGFLRSNSGRPFLQTFGNVAPMTRTPPSSRAQSLRQLSLRPSPLQNYDNRGTPDGRDSRRSDHVPSRVPSVPGFMEPLRALLRSQSIIPGYSALQLIIMMNYTYILLYGAFRMSNPFTDNTRSAWLSVSQLPLIFALAQKSNILGSLLGYGYETLNYLHRYAGRLSVLAGNIHSIYYIFKWTNAGTFSQAIARPKNAWGLVLLIAMDVLFFFSLEFWRRKAYNVFFWSHTMGVLVLFPSACLHRPALQPYAFACVALYGLDRLIRAVKSKLSTANITALPQLDMAYLEIPEISYGWRAGQHVRLRVLSPGMGVMGWSESHPFTIASASGSEAGLVLLCKSAGDWTEKLVNLAGKLESQQEPGRVKVWIEGPFGGPSRMMFASFSAAVLVCGGSGVTFGISMVEELLVKDRKDESRLKFVELIWVVPNPSCISPLIPLFTSLIHQTEHINLRISIHYTRALVEKVAVYGRIEVRPYTPIAITHPNITLTPGRPNFKNVLNNAIDQALGAPYDDKASRLQSFAHGLAVGICGPISLGDEVVTSVRGIDGATRFQVGGVEIHEETFGW